MGQHEKKLIAIDLDGTLLTREKTIAPRTKRALQQAMELGHHVVIATGRPPRASLNIYNELQLRTPMVNFNGAFVHHAQDEAWGQYHFPIERELAFQVIEACEQFEIHSVMVEVKDDYYLNRHDPEFVSVLAGGHKPLGVGSIRELLADHPTSVLIRPNEHRIKELRQHLSDYHADMVEHRLWGAPWNVIEMCKAGINKWTGLEVVAKSLGITREHVIAFGDEDNDLEMIQNAGYGVAMANANPLLKEVAAHITESNDNDGIAVVLERLL